MLPYKSHTNPAQGWEYHDSSLKEDTIQDQQVANRNTNAPVTYVHNDIPPQVSEQAETEKSFLNGFLSSLTNLLGIGS